MTTLYRGALSFTFLSVDIVPANTDTIYSIALG